MYYICGFYCLLWIETDWMVLLVFTISTDPKCSKWSIYDHEIVNRSLNIFKLSSLEFIAAKLSFQRFFFKKKSLFITKSYNRLWKKDILKQKLLKCESFHWYLCPPLWFICFFSRYFVVFLTQWMIFFKHIISTCLILVLSL